MELTQTQKNALADAASADALAYFASKTALRNAIKSLYAGEFSAWSPEVQTMAADNLAILMDCYKS